MKTQEISTAQTDPIHSSRDELEFLTQSLMRFVEEIDSAKQEACEQPPGPRYLTEVDLNHALLIVDLVYDTVDAEKIKSAKLEVLLENSTLGHGNDLCRDAQIIEEWSQRCHFLCAENSYLKTRIAILEEALQDRTAIPPRHADFQEQ